MVPNTLSLLPQHNPVANSPEWLWLDSVEIQACPTFEQQKELLVGNLGVVKVNLQGQQKGEENLVSLIQTPRKGNVDMIN